MKKVYYILIILISLIFTGCADKPTETTTLGSVHGTVFDQSNNSELSGVIVSIQNVGNRTTDNNGYFEFLDLEENTYTLTAEKAGYVVETAQVEIEANTNKEVNFTLHTAQPAQLLVSPTNLNFGQTVSSLNITVNNGGDEELSWQITSNQSWLSTFPTTGTTTTEEDQVTVTVNRSGLEVGNYNGNLSVTSNGGDFNVPVQMEVTPIVLIIDPNSLDFGNVETDLSFTISNTGNGTLNWSLTPNQNWITANPTSGSITNDNETITVNVDRAGLAPDTYNGSISITSNVGNQNVNITMTVLEQVNIVDHFDNLDNWTNTTQSITDPWVITPYGYEGNCAMSQVAAYGDQLSQTFNFTTDVTLSIWACTSVYEDIAIDVKVDGEIVIHIYDLDGEWEQRQCDITAGEHEIVIETYSGGTAWVDELEITSN